MIWMLILLSPRMSLNHQRLWYLLNSQLWTMTTPPKLFLPLQPKSPLWITRLLPRILMIKWITHRIIIKSIQWWWTLWSKTLLWKMAKMWSQRANKYRNSNWQIASHVLRLHRAISAFRANNKTRSATAVLKGHKMLTASRMIITSVGHPSINREDSFMHLVQVTSQQSAPINSQKEIY